MTDGLTHKAAVLTEPGHNPKFAIRQIPRPVPGPTDVLIRLSATSVCGSDYGLAAGELGPPRTVLGHEGVGRVVALGSAVLAGVDDTVRVGQRVGLAWNRDVCGRCQFCADLAHDGETRCAARLVSGLAHDGTFAEYAVVPARYLIRLPEDDDAALPDDVVAPVLCAGVTAYKALKISGARPGQTVAVSGVGGVGLLALAYAKAMGLRTIGVDLGPDKGALATGPHGRADHYVDVLASAKDDANGAGSASPTVGDAVKKCTPDGQGVAAVLVCAGAPAAYQAAFGMLAPFGALVCVGLLAPDKTVAFHPTAFVANGWRLLGSAVGTRADILEALDFVRRGEVRPLTQPARLEDVERLVNEVGRGQSVGKYIIKLGGGE